MKDETPTIRYYSGLDLGQAQDFTALAVLEKTILPEPLPQEPERAVGHYAVRHLERFPLGTPYAEVCTWLRERYAEAPLRDSVVMVDQTGVGKPVYDLVRKARIGARMRAVAITAGHKASMDEGTWIIPKIELVSTLQVLLQARRIKVSLDLPQAQTLIEELQNFQVKVTDADKEDALSWRERPHDDLVLAVAIAAWQGERGREVNMRVLPEVVPWMPERGWQRWG
jgi:hypothetical protein